MNLIESIWFDPAGFLCLRFRTYDDRADFLEKYGPTGDAFINMRFNSDGPPWRLGFGKDCGIVEFASAAYLEQESRE